MKAQWPLQEAKNRLGYVVEQACNAGPQEITVRGQVKAVLVSAETYKRLTRPAVPLTAFFRRSPLYGVDLDVERRRSDAR